MKNFIAWLQAYAAVYSRRAGQLSSKTLSQIAVLAVAIILALILGPLGMLALALIVLFILPVINNDIRKEVEEEYNKHK